MFPNGFYTIHTLVSQSRSIGTCRFPINKSSFVSSNMERKSILAIEQLTVSYFIFFFPFFIFNSLLTLLPQELKTFFCSYLSLISLTDVSLSFASAGISKSLVYQLFSNFPSNLDEFLCYFW